MKTVRRDTIRKLYREGMLQIFGCGDNELDKQLIKSMKQDMHIAGQGPGQWVSREGVLEIYCENGIPNASDMHDFRYECEEFGLDPSNAVVHNCDQWYKLDEYVNLYLKSVGRPERVHHEPFNGAVVGIYWS